MKNRQATIEKRVLLHSRQALRLLYAAVAAGFLAVACLVGAAYLLSEVVDGVFLKKQTLGDVSALLAALVALAAVRAAMLWCGDVLAQRSASRLKGGLRKQLTRHLSALGPAYTRGER